MMATVMIRHRVADFEAWNRGYNEADWLRKQHGILFACVHRDEIDRTVVMATHRFRDMDRAKAFVDAALTLNLYFPDLPGLDGQSAWRGRLGLNGIVFH